MVFVFMWKILRVVFEKFRHNYSQKKQWLHVLQYIYNILNSNNHFISTLLKEKT